MTEEEQRQQQMMMNPGTVPPMPPGGLYSQPPVLPVPAYLIQQQMLQAGQNPASQQPQASGFKRVGQNLGNMFGMGNESEQYRAQGMADPRGAAWGQALSNIAAMNMGGIPQTDPFTAYQRQVLANAQVRLTQETARRTDPYYEFELGKARGHIPEDMTWQEFEQSKSESSTSNQRDFGHIMYLRRPKQEDETEEQYKARLESSTLLENIVQKPFVFDQGGGGVGVTSAIRPGQSPIGYGAPGAEGAPGGAPTGGPGSLVSPADATSREADLAGAKQDATSWATIDSSWQAGYGATYPDVLYAAKKTNELISFIEANPDMNTGMIRGHITPMMDEIVAYMDAMSSLLTVPALKDAGLNPVTENEWETIKGLFASARRDPKANIGAMTATYNNMVSSLERMAAVQQYYVNHGTTKGYGASVGGGEALKPRAFPGNQPSSPAEQSGLIDIPGVD